MSAARYDIIINQGSVFEMSIQLVDDVTANPIDLTGAVGTLKIATKDFTTVLCVVDDVHADNGSISILEPLVGKALVLISSDATSALPNPPKNDDPFYEGKYYVYQLDITQDGKTKRYMQGFVTIIRGIT